MPYRDNIISLKQNMMDEEYYRKVMNKFKRAKVLLIDDLFKGSISGSDVNIMFEIINYRYLNGLPVIVSCEKSIDEIMNIDEAIGSRLYEMSCGYVASLSGRRLNYRMYGEKLVSLTSFFRCRENRRGIFILRIYNKCVIFRI